MSPGSNNRRSTPLVALLTACLLALAGCGSAGSSSGKDNPMLDITISGKTITPTNKRIEVSKGKPLMIMITSDRSGELHLHSSPEQHIEFAKGTTKKTLTFTTPGVIEVEEHTSDTLIAQLEVR